MLSDLGIGRLLEECTRAGTPLLQPPPDSQQLQPASVDLRLGTEFKQYTRPLGDITRAEPMRLDRPVDPKWMQSFEGPGLLLLPNQFTLATTVETVWMPVTHAAQVEGRSSLGRRGLIVHATAGFIDPGFRGQITLEMLNLSPRPILLTAGTRICQLTFYKMDERVLRPYGHHELRSKYQGQAGATAPEADKEA
jgi:dCTP deaminase